jgi:hypothetical protein
MEIMEFVRKPLRLHDFATNDENLEITIDLSPGFVPEINDIKT